MNVIVSNKYEAMLSSLEIEVIKSMNGEFDVDEIISTFDNFYFQRMILDITSIKDYKDISKLQQITIKLDINKIILLLDSSPDSKSPAFLSQLVSMGIYNFTTNKEGLMYLLEHPNQYRDVAHLHKVKPIEENRDGSNGGSHSVITNTVTNTEVVYQKNKIIGFKNVTKNAGSSSLVYMMKKELETVCNVIGIEVNGSDFQYFNDANLVSCTDADFGKALLNASNADVVLVDLKDNTIDNSFKELIYLVEPSIIKINKLMALDNNIFSKLKDRKIVLNRSMLSSKDILDFEYETKVNIFAQVPCLNDRETGHVAIRELLQKLGVM